MITIPPELGAVGDTAEDVARLGDIQAHVHAVLKHRALSPAEQVTVLVSLASTITVQGVPDVRRALRFLSHLAGRCFAEAEVELARRSKHDNALRDAAPAGRA